MGIKNVAANLKVVSSFLLLLTEKRTEHRIKR